MKAQPTSEQNSDKNYSAKGLRGLLLTELLEVYASEKMLSTELPGIINKISNPRLVHALQNHLESIRLQILNLDRVFFLIGGTEENSECPVVAALIKKAQFNSSHFEKSFLRDVSIINVILQIDHFGIAAYGTLCSLAKTLQKVDVATTLHQMLVSKKEANEVFSDIIEAIEVQMIFDCTE